MRAMRIHEYGGPEVLSLDDVPKPEYREGEVLLRVEAAGVNFADLRHRQGLYPWGAAPPTILGLEAAGVVEEVGPKVTSFKPGDRVAALVNHTYAEYARVSTAMLMPLLGCMDFITGAAFPIQALTAYHLTHTSFPVQPGQTVLIHAAAGGVGLLLVQMAKLRGATVYGTVSSDAKARAVAGFGADAVINYAANAFDEEVLRLTNGEGVDVIFDAVGRDTLEKDFKALKLFGNLVTYGAASGNPDPLPPRVLFEKSLHLSGFVLYTVARLPALWRQGIEQVTRWLSDGTLKLTIHKVLPLEQAAEAQQLLNSRETVGKLVLQVGKEK